MAQRDRPEDDFIGVVAAERLGRRGVVIAGEPDDVDAAREPGKLGDIGGALGKSIKEFKKASKDEDAEAAAAPQATAQPQASAQSEPAPAAPVAVNGVAAEKSTPVVAGDYRPPDAKPN